MSIYLQIEI